MIPAVTFNPEHLYIYMHCKLSWDLKQTDDQLSQGSCKKPFKSPTTQ